MTRAIGYLFLLLLMIIIVLHFGRQMYKGIKSPDWSDNREQID